MCKYKNNYSFKEINIIFIIIILDNMAILFNIIFYI